MKFDINTLEFESFKEFLLDNFISSFSKSSFKIIDILSDIESIYKRQNEIKQAVEYRESTSFIDDDNDFFSLFYSLTDKTKSFDPMDFVVIKNFLIKLSSLKEALEEKKYIHLLIYSESFSLYQHLIDLISKSINDKGVVKDDATPRLQEIRYSLNQFKNNIRKILSNIFNSSNADKFIQDKVIVLRNGRYTIPCKTNFSQYIQGIIQDKSASGQTLYIEPASCVSENNAMQELIIAESEEIAKIIFTLITAVKSSLIDLNKTVKNYSYLIMILEIGQFYSNKVHTFGECGDSMVFNQIHHPLLYLRKGENSIALDFTIEHKGDHIIITGSNTGGKTAALKSIGLNHLITYCGLPVFGSYFKFMQFQSILADIGDNQSIIMDLSTFSSHMVNINNIVNRADSNTLILFDELGTGTEPREGASLAVAVLKYLRKKGATVILTTHFTEVKNYALNTDNAYFYAVDFDYDNLSPRYKLIKDVMGKSDPIMIAERLGFNKEIIKEAEEELMRYKSLLEVQVEELNRMRAEAEHTKKILDAKEKELQEKEELFNAANKELQKKLNSKEIDLLEETYALLQKSKRLANQKEKISNEEIEQVIKKTSNKIADIKSKQVTVEDIKVNNIIFLDKYQTQVKILEISGSNVTVDLNGMKMKMKRNDIVGHKVEQIKPKQVKISDNTSKSSTKREIILVGKRVEEALDLLEKFIDDLLLTNYDKAYIVHGRGSGQLRKAIHEYLRVHPKVAKYHLAENNDGGNAVTIIEL